MIHRWFNDQRDPTKYYPESSQRTPEGDWFLGWYMHDSDYKSETRLEHVLSPEVTTVIRVNFYWSNKL